MLVEESANITRERPVVGLPGRIQRNRRLAVGVAYLLPARFAFGDKGWKLVMAIVTTLMATPLFEWTRRKPRITKPAPAD